MSKSDNRCVFCRIANLQDPYTRILFQDEEFVAFRDIRPAADHHYLIVTKQHIKNPKQLKAEDLEMFERLIATGEKVLENAGGKYEEARFGFHWPPFTSVNHLHLHVISPVLSMNFLSRLIFRENSYWFVTANWMSNRLKTMKNESADRTKDQSNL
ncbi:adenosine 5'-monophosphoramidase HINT3-like [Saccostrea echinata]|uniref:adenosine 5'-monophosphoramidase HINT3-like n=1 Tax=Saccostrea echinata TaxID=191078 RepID=UPI002A816C07|nr:adenosine 5'-monophosphoramidase HINT3-like [Saccostrea echinata]